jgi:tripartite-type tricarboxylate transporter receptor subunit TctC
MKVRRRQFLRLAAGAAAALPAGSRFAWAQSYPTRPVRIIVGSAAGGTTDIVARLMGQWLSERLGQPFVIENKTGGGGNIATEAVVRAAPDGFTLLVAGSNATISATLYRNLNFNILRDIAPVASISRETPILLVNPSVPAKTVLELIAHAKTNPGKLNFASGGIGTTNHVFGELFKMMTGADMVHVPYRGGGPALTDLLGGQVQVMFPTVTSSIAYIRAGTLRALAVTTPTRSEILPDVPTVGEFVPGYEASTMFGVGAPRNTPAEIVVRLNREINAALVDPRMRARIVDTGASVLASSPAHYGKLLEAEVEKWAEVVKFSGARPD